MLLQDRARLAQTCLPKQTPCRKRKTGVKSSRAPGIRTKFRSNIKTGRCILTAKHVNNVALIQVFSKTFTSEVILGQTIYRGVDEFEEEVGQQIRDRLTKAGVGCSLVQRSFKPSGSMFIVASPSGDYFVYVGAEQEALPGAEVSIRAEPRRKAAIRSWSWFEPLFRRAVETGFTDPIRWMTVDEYVANGRIV